jgi:hypothetical protein
MIENIKNDYIAVRIKNETNLFRAVGDIHIILANTVGPCTSLPVQNATMINLVA